MKRVIQTLVLSNLCLLIGCGAVFRDVPIAADGYWLLLPDYDIPELSYLYPEDGAEGVEVNKSVVIAFTKEMDFEKDESGTMTVRCENTGMEVPGEVLTSGGKVMVFRPGIPLDGMSGYRVTVNRNLEDVDGKRIPIRGLSWAFATGPHMDTDPPYVTARVPGESSTHIGLDASVRAEFSELINPVTVTSETVKLRNGLIDVPARVGYDRERNAVTLAPEALSLDTLYTVVLLDVEDLAGNQIDGAVTWDFTTESGGPEPGISTRYPGIGDSNIGVNDFIILAFTRDMDFTDIEGAIELQDIYGTSVTGTIRAYGSRMIIFKPSRKLNFQRMYTARVTRDFIGTEGRVLPARDHSWSFTTARDEDREPPVIWGRFPEDGATVDSTTPGVKVYFNEQIDPFSVDDTTFRVREAGADIIGTYRYSVENRMVFFEPDVPFRDNTPYTVDVSGITDMSGNPMPGRFYWTFDTAVREEPVVTEYRLVNPEELEPGRYVFQHPPRPLCDNFGNLLASGVDFVYGEPLTGTYNIVDTGISGPLDTANGRYFRIVHNGANILDLGLTPVAWDLSTTASPPGDSFYVDPVRGEFVLPRPSYWTRMESEENLGAHADICEGKPFVNRSIDKSEDITNISYSEYEYIFFNGKFNRCYWQRSFSSSNSKTNPAWIDGMIIINPFGYEKKYFNTGVFSFWFKSIKNKRSPIGTIAKAEGHWYLHLSDELIFHIYYINEKVFSEIIIDDIIVENKEIAILAEQWYHVYLVWGNLSDFNTIKIYFNNNEVLNLSHPLPLSLSQPIKPIIIIKNHTFAQGAMVCYDSICGFINASMKLYNLTDNIKLYNHVCSESPEWEYMSGNGNENAIHPIYNKSEFFPVLNGNSNGVGYILVK